MEAETREVHLEETSERLHSNVDKKSEQIEVMWDRIQALENHNKRNNVRLVGLKETFGTNVTLLICVQKILTEGLVIQSLILREHTDPWLVIIRFLRQSARDKVVNAAKEKCGFEWKGCRLSVFPDMSRELAENRKAFTSVKRKLQEFNVKYTLAYPVTLHFKWKGENLSFTTASAADKFTQ